MTGYTVTSCPNGFLATGAASHITVTGLTNGAAYAFTVTATNSAGGGANDSEYGLAAAVFGRDIARTLQVARRIECGVCRINGATVNSEPRLPSGGVKASGHGRFGGKAAINEFTDLRLITVQTEPQSFPF